MKKLLKDLGITISYNLCAFLIGLIICSMLIRIDFFNGIIYIYFFRMTLYSMISALIVSTVFLMLTIAKKTANKLKVLENKLIFSGFAISFLLIYTFLNISSFVSDRSYTIFSLGYLYESADKSFTLEEMEQIFIDGFVNQFDATEKRLKEQLNTGYIEKDSDGKYRISQSGKQFVRLLRFIDVFFPTATNPSSLYPDGNPKREIIKN